MSAKSKTSSTRHTLKIVLATVLVMFLLAAAFLGYRAFFRPMLEGVSIGGVDISGLSAMEARKLVTHALEESLYRQPLSVVLPEETLLLSPEECGVSVDLSKALRDALHLKAEAPEKELSLLPYLTVNEAYIRSLLTDYAAKYDTEYADPTWVLEGAAPALGTEEYDAAFPCQTLVVTMGVPSLHLDVAEIFGSILFTYADAVPLCREEAYSLTPEVHPEKVPALPDAAAIYEEFSVEAVSDSLDMETFGFIHGSYGLTFDQENLDKQIGEAEDGAAITMQLEYVQPEVMGEDTYYQDVLGAFETKHTDNENRNTNLKLLCAAMDGFVLQPGDTFSFNEVVGERTKEKGYMPAPAYSGNRLVDSVGGGVCQGSTTLYNCVLLADMEVITRVCHGAKVGYVPLGLDASVNWGTTEFIFRNNWNFPVKIQAWVADGYVHMQLLGTDEKDYYIKMEATNSEDENVIYARSWKCKYDKETDERISRESEAFSTYYKNIG